MAIETGTVLILAAVLTIPVAAFYFASGAGKALKQVGKGAFSIEQQFPAAGTGPVRPATREEREAEIRQMLEGRAYRAEARGDTPVDVDAEMDKILAAERGTASLQHDPELREEVRQLVIARNERRERAGKPPLDVEEEIERQLRDLEDVGQ